MINVTNVVTFLLERVKHEYKHEKTTCTSQVKDIAFQLFLTLKTVLEIPGIIETDTILDIAESYEIDDNGETDDEIEETESSQSSQE